MGEIEKAWVDKMNEEGKEIMLIKLNVNNYNPRLSNIFVFR